MDQTPVFSTLPGHTGPIAHLRMAARNPLQLQVLEILAPSKRPRACPDIERRDLLGGLVHEYMRAP